MKNYLLQLSSGKFKMVSVENEKYLINISFWDEVVCFTLSN